jgi:radical SAM protein with 4Fe4S-binding SPASM domain
MSDDGAAANGGIATALQPVEPGLHPFMKLEGEWPTRFHLRVDPDGGGLLLANAAEAAHLSPVGVMMVHGVLSDLSDEAIAAAVRARFHGGTGTQIASDLEQVRALLDDLRTPEDNYPVTNFGGAAESPDERRLGAPFQAHVVQGDPEATEPILRALWDAGIPQVTFLAEPGLDASDLVRLVECAGDIGMITGVRAAAGWLSEEQIRAAGMAGLDFLTLVLAHQEPAKHDAVLGAGDHEAFRQAVAVCHDLELCSVAQVPLTDETADEVEEIVEFALVHDTRNFSFFAIACLDGEEEADAAGALPARAMPQVATTVTECAEDADVRFIWEAPVRFDLGRTLADHIIAGPRAGGDVSIRVEPDGTVCPPRGKKLCCGNILEHPWSEIWQHEAFTRYRESVEAPQRCDACPDLELCAAACPKDPAGWADDTENGGAP